MGKAQIGQLLAKSTKVDDPAFWDSFDSCCSAEEPFDSRVSPKAKQNLISVIRFSCTSSDKSPGHMSTVIKCLHKMSESPGFMGNFKEKDSAFFQSINMFVLNVFEKQETQSATERKISLLTALYHLFSKSPLFVQKCAPEVSNQIITLISNRNTPFEVCNRAISLLFNLAEDPKVAEIVSQRSQNLQQIIMQTEYPRIQLQVLELFWRVNIPIAGTSFSECDSQLFISQAHKLVTEITKNQRPDERIYHIEINEIRLPGSTYNDNGWIDIGFEDMILCFGETIATIKFDDVDGLDNLDGEFKITLANSNEELGANAGDVISMHFIHEYSNEQIAKIFERISKGESASASQRPFEETHDYVQNEQIEPEQIVSPAKRSSIAVQKQQEEKTSIEQEVENKLPGQQDFEGPVKSKVHLQQETEDLPDSSIVLSTEEEAKTRNRIRSSVALFIPESLQNIKNGPQLEKTSQLFTSDDSSSSLTDSTFQNAESITTPESYDQYSEENTQSSPPPLDINMNQYTIDSFFPQTDEISEVSKNEDITNNEKNKKTNEEKPPRGKGSKKANTEKKSNSTSTNKTKNSNKGKLVDQNDEDSGQSEPETKVEQDYFGQYPQRVATVLENGMNSLTKGQLDQIDLFSENLHRRVEAFKEDLQSTLRERENGSMKQVDSARARFLENIQSFKRREAGIHQSLNAYEESTKTIAQKLTHLQRMMRQEVQKHKENLETELANLRKIVRQDDDESNDEDDSFDF